jgi:hypothetical protein
MNGMPGSGSPELEILVDGKCDDFEGGGSDLRPMLFQRSIVFIHFFRLQRFFPPIVLNMGGLIR